MLISFAGGVLIGAAALLLYAVSGRVAGVSGIAFGALWQAPAERSWRWLFLAGLVLGGWLAVLAGAREPGAPFPDTPAGTALLLAAGLLVGLGTRIGNGCTSGHGICGMSRLSPRSLVATVVFMFMGMLVATWLRPWLSGGLS